MMVIFREIYFMMLILKDVYSAGLDGKGVGKHMYAPANVILKTRVVCHMPKILYGVSVLICL